MDSFPFYRLTPFSTGNVLKLINETTGFQHLRKIQGTFDAANESGHYVVFSPYHIIYGRVLPDGSRFLYDPQIHRVLQNWDEAMIVLRSKTPEIHLLTLPK